MNAIIFDLGGVILDIDISRTNNAFRELGFEKIDDYFGLGHASGFFSDYEDGSVSDDEFVESVRKILEYKVSEEEVIKAWNALLIRFPEERIGYLKELKKQYRLFLFSNTNGIHQQAFAKMYEKEFGGILDDLFEKAYYSHTEGFRKPDGTGFFHILKENNLDPKKTFFVDDAWVNVEAANKVGIIGVHLEPGKSVLDLKF